MNSHLTEAQLCDLLSTTPESASADAHLAECSLCANEFSTLRQSLSSFRLAASNYSLLHTPPRPVVGTTVQRSFFAVPRLVWAGALAAVLAVTGVTVSNLHKPAAVTPNVTTATTGQPVSDEALLQDIDSDLSTSVPPSLQPLDTTSAGTEQTTISTSN